MIQNIYYVLFTPKTNCFKKAIDLSTYYDDSDRNEKKDSVCY